MYNIHFYYIVFSFYLYKTFSVWNCDINNFLLPSHLECVYVQCTFIYVSVSVCVYEGVCLHVCVCTLYVYACMCVHVFVCVCVFVCVFECMCVCVCLYVCVCLSALMRWSHRYNINLYLCISERAYHICVSG